MHIFHSGTPNYAKQGVPDACFKIPSENPELTNLVWSYFPQINVSGKQNQSQKHYEVRDISNALTDPGLHHFARAITVISLVHAQPNSIQIILPV